MRLTQYVSRKLKMEIERVALFINKLSEKSKLGTIEWKVETSNSYQATINGYKVTISEHLDEDDFGDVGRYADPDYIVGLYKLNSHQWVDSFNDDEMKDYMNGSFKIMQGIYRDARRKSNNVSEIIEDLISGLDE